MKRNIFLIKTASITLLLGVIFFICCSEIPDGFLPDKIIYPQNPVVVQKGIAATNVAPNLNGASTPLSFRITGVKDANGNPTTVLTDSIPTRVWTAPYDFETDKSMDDIYAKLDVSDQPIMRIIRSSGQLSFTDNSLGVPEGEYIVSVEMSNSAGSIEYEDILMVRFDPAEYWYTLENGGGQYAWKSEYKGDDNNGGNGHWNGDVAQRLWYEIEYDPDGENLIELMILDKNGNPFSWANPKEVYWIESATNNLEAKVFSTPTYTSDRAIYEFPFAPYPFGSSTDVSQYEYRYRVFADYLTFTEEEKSGWLEMLISFRALADGRFVVKVRNDFVIRNN